MPRRCSISVKWWRTRRGTIAARSAVSEEELEPQVTVGLFDLLPAFRRDHRAREERPMMQVDREEFSIEQMMGYLFDQNQSSSTRSLR